MSASAPPKPADKDHMTRVDVVLKADPFSDASLHALEALASTIKDLTATGKPLAGATSFGMTGPTATVGDLRKVTRLDDAGCTSW